MTWIDSGNWDPVRGKELVCLIAEAYSDGEMVRLVDDAGISRQVLPAPDKLGLRWHSLLVGLNKDGRLRVLLRVAVDGRPALAEKIAVLDADDPQAAGNPPDPYHARLVGPGKHPMIDRVTLRGNLRRFLDEPMPVLVVRGPADCGKSHSFELIKHVVGGRADKELVHIDFAPDCGTTAVELMDMIRARLDLPGVFRRPRDTTATRSAAQLMNEFVGAYRSKDRTKRILVMDGLDRADLEPDVHALVARLAVEVVNLQLWCTQLVLTGYTGRFDPHIRYSIVPEDVRDITETDVLLYFEGLATDLGRPLSPERLAALVQAAMAGEPGLAALAERVQTAALALIEAP
jgi:hypothetical protein